MHTTLPRRVVPATMSARRSTSLVPRTFARATSQRALPFCGFKPSTRPPRPTTRVSPTAISKPARANIKGSPVRCCCHSFCPVAASKALIMRSPPSTKTRPPATKGAVRTKAWTLARQSSLPCSSTTSELPWVTTAMRVASPPKPEVIGVPRSTRQFSTPVAALHEAMRPAFDMTSTSEPSALISRGSSPSALALLHSTRTGRLEGLAASAAGLGLSGPAQAPSRRVVSAADNKQKRGKLRQISSRSINPLQRRPGVPRPGR